MNKEYSGVLFPTKTKKSDKSPDFTGRITINGEEVHIVGWNSSSPKCESYIKISKAQIEIQEVKQEPAESVSKEILNDDFPF